MNVWWCVLNSKAGSQMEGCSAMFCLRPICLKCFPFHPSITAILASPYPFDHILHVIEKKKA